MGQRIAKVTCVLGILSGMGAQAVAGTSSEFSKVIVRVVGLDGSDGIVMIALEKSRAHFDKGKTNVASYRGKWVKVEGNTAIAIFDHIPFGEYAIKAFHDKNGNQILDANFLGIPTERYGFSNNAWSAFGPAKFDEAKFSVKDVEVIQSIELK